MKLSRILCIVIVCMCGSAARAIVVHDESTDGPLSDDPATPSILAFAPGANQVAMTFGPPGSPDIIAFTIGANQSLDAIVLDSYAGNRPFLGIKAIDPTDDFPATLPTGGAQLLAGYLFDQNSLGDDIFETGLLLAGSRVASLGPGQYWMWFNETGGSDSIQVNFSVVPLPSTSDHAVLRRCAACWDTPAPTGTCPDVVNFGTF